MKWERVHQGVHRQWIPVEEREAFADATTGRSRAARAARAALPPLGITPDLHAPEIVSPADEPELNLHGDVEGSPYGRNPGEMSLAEAAEQEKADAEGPAEDMADTRAREAESRRTGVPTEVLAAEDDAKPARASRKK